MNAEAAYADLTRRAKEIATLHSCAAVLGWDQQTYMPRKGAALRGDQLALLGTSAHQKLTDPAVGELLILLEASSLAADSPEAANVRELRRGYDRAVKVPQALIEELARVTAQAQPAWDRAKKSNDFPTFQPWLERVVALKREEAAAVGFADHPYDALLDEYEPGAKTADIREVFAGLTRELAPLIKAIAQSGKKPDRTILERDYPIDRQKLFAESAAVALGFDFAAGRLDTTSHPFCSGVGPGDCRITTRYNPRFFSESFFGVLHETGHAIYEQNLPAEQFGMPLGSACSLGIHESQSRLWENQVGRGKAFWRHFFPRARQAFPTALADTSPDDFYAAINDVKPSLIRVEADEATYNLHVALRFELELAMVSGDLTVAELPGAWNSRFEQLFGIAVPDDTRGCLQDIHWSFGGIGYFPTYTLGNLYSAQFMQCARRELPGIEDIGGDFERGEFGRLKAWLAHNIHRHGRRYPAHELCRRVTGSDLSHEPFLAHLAEKYRPLYGVC